MKCSKCHFDFQEKTTQYYKRIRQNLAPLCRDCQRIDNAEEAARKREILKNETQEEKNLRKAKFYKQKFKTLSPMLLMMKFKICREEAEKMIQIIG